MRILITGGAGFVGSNLVHFLVDEGHDVCVLDDLSNGTLRNLEGIDYTFKHIDLAKQRQIETDGFDLVYHLACGKMSHSVLNPVRDLLVNALGTLKILESVRKNGIPVIYTSTGSVYGNPKVFPTPEDHSLVPESPYGVSKLAAEEYCKLYTRMYGLRTVIVRLHSVYGPRQSLIGVIPKFILQTMRGEPMTIEGDGEQERSFTYIDDCVKALIIASEHGINGETYNVASDKFCSINELSEIIPRILDKPRKVVYIERKKGDLNLTNPSTEKMQAIDWKPRTYLHEGIRNTIDWVKTINLDEDSHVELESFGGR